jgi:hypothetical protein
MAMNINNFCALLCFTALLNANLSCGQVTDHFTVTGAIKKELKFSLPDLEKYPASSVPDLVITNHVGQPRGTATQLKGVLVKELLKGLEPDEPSPKLYSEFYLVFTAVDGYKVVYSWNEIFNSPTGEHLYIIISRDGKPLSQMSERVLVLTTTDFMTGRRHIKGLANIRVERVK